MRVRLNYHYMLVCIVSLAFCILLATPAGCASMQVQPGQPPARSARQVVFDETMLFVKSLDASKTAAVAGAAILVREGHIPAAEGAKARELGLKIDESEKTVLDALAEYIKLTDRDPSAGHAKVLEATASLTRLVADLTVLMAIWRQ